MSEGVAAVLLVPLSILATAFLVHGFNFITIHKHYYRKEED